jgi:cation transport ATPase
MAMIGRRETTRRASLPRMGVAMGARGSDPRSANGVVLMHDAQSFLAAYRLSRLHRHHRRNVGISLGVIVVLVVCALLDRSLSPSACSDTKAARSSCP